MPVLIAIYPVAIVLIFLTFINYAIPVHTYVYRGAILLTILISIPNAIEGAGLVEFGFLHALPLDSEGVGWLIPAVAGGMIGFIMLQYKQKK
ncbi:branched-chain amino acid transport system II carrier protein [Guptibacillus hwajinpoensis]|uniref:Branched-chain amino acid transport system carrier protein n=1 Tax=Guptibacillus hwajinpoensis TaxID=208199 RepID=A0A0J6CXI5_9BACL|nr:branched-chain amino acid transport system II carrier protein [Alkalihalobacillus macyae]KMM36754.1 hypothetical protein AB986_12500 [Alkalihalobacillus macyae]